MLDFDEEEFICVMTEDGDKQQGCLRLVMVLAAIILMVDFLAML